MTTQRAGRPLDCGSCILIPLEKMHAGGAAAGGTIGGFISLEPIAIVVLSRKGMTILDMEGSPAPVIPYVEEVEGLPETVGRFSFL